jgi:hypothetical protein
MPKIEKFAPVNGSKFGNETINIHLNYKNYTKIINITVTIAGVKCDVISFDESIIECKTGAVIELIFGHIFSSDFLLKKIFFFAQIKNDFFFKYRANRSSVWIHRYHRRK